MCTHAWRAEDALQESVLSFHVGARGRKDRYTGKFLGCSGRNSGSETLALDAAARGVSSEGQAMIPSSRDVQKKCLLTQENMVLLPLQQGFGQGSLLSSHAES